MTQIGEIMVKVRIEQYGRANRKLYKKRKKACFMRKLELALWAQAFIMVCMMLILLTIEVFYA